MKPNTINYENSFQVAQNENKRREKKTEFQYFPEKETISKWESSLFFFLFVKDVFWALFSFILRYSLNSVSFSICLPVFIANDTCFLEAEARAGAKVVYCICTVYEGCARLDMSWIQNEIRKPNLISTKIHIQIIHTHISSTYILFPWIHWFDIYFLSVDLVRFGFGLAWLGLGSSRFTVNTKLKWNGNERK